MQGLREVYPLAARRRRRGCGLPVRGLACPNCGHEPATRPEALQQREDLAVIWLHQDRAHGPIIRRRYCANCQPRNNAAAVLECSRCGDGPILTGILATYLNQNGNGPLPTELRSWLTSDGWQLGPRPLCPHERPTLPD